ncbi:MAG: DUF2238 domain-containing protein [Ferruginibacter sp.]
MAALLFAIIWVGLYITSIDKTDWWIENILVFLFFSGLFFAQQKFIFSDTSLVFLFLFLTLHIYGAQGAYTHNQLGEWLQAVLKLSRNPYDRIVHFSFGFLPAYPIMDVFNAANKNHKLLIFNINMAILCLATIFELIEWGVASFTDAATGESYVATQGDPWDAQKDIFLAIIGSLLFSFIYNIFRRLKSIVPDYASVE